MVLNDDMRRAPGFDAASRYLDELVHQGSLQGLERSDEDVAAKCGLLTLVKQHNWQDKANFLLILCRGPRLPRQVDQHVAEFLLPRGSLPPTRGCFLVSCEIVKTPFHCVVVKGNIHHLLHFRFRRRSSFAGQGCCRIVRS